MNQLLSIFIFLIVLSPIAVAAEPIVVVVNSGSAVDTLSQNEVVNIFLGRFRQFSSGIAAQPVDLPVSHPARADFYRLLVGKSPAEINAYWARLIFSGQTLPPIQTDRQEDAINAIQNKPGGIGYLERSKVGGRLKIVFEFTQ
jgi:ABC-type phosphate transport system substrate-binding protein